MSQQQEHRQTQDLYLKKSQFDLGEGQPEKQEAVSAQEVAKVGSPHENIGNLLDLDESVIERKKKYQTFICDRQISIEGPQLVTQNVIKSYKLYQVKTRKRESASFDTCVSRRFSDFEYLQKQLFQLYGGCIIPLLPEKNIWANVNMEGDQQIRSRVQGLEKYLNSLMNHRKLRMSEEVRNFLFEDEVKFSEKKGQYFSKVKTQQKIKQLASNAYKIGRGVFNNLFHRWQLKQEEEVRVIKPTIEDVRLMEYQRQVTDLIRVINVLRKVVENSVLEMESIGQMMPHSKEAEFSSLEILSQFEDLCKYIFSCNEALARRHRVRTQIDQLGLEFDSVQKKIKSNPRSQEVDLLRNKLAKATQKCENWTSCLLEELQESITLGKSMIQDFINYYSDRKGRFYDL